MYLFLLFEKKKKNRDNITSFEVLDFSVCENYKRIQENENDTPMKKQAVDKKEATKVDDTKDQVKEKMADNDQTVTKFNNEEKKSAS